MQQLPLALEQIINKLPAKPYCSDDLSYGVKVRPKAIALLKRYIQANHPYYTNFLIFDLDYPTAYVDFFYAMVGVPTPNLIVENPENGHAHYIYQLETPIYNTDASRPKPIQYGNAIYMALREVLQADQGYTGLITKNALHEHWRTHLLREQPYTLKQLSERLDLTTHKINKPIAPDEAVGLGRNCCIFHTVRKWAYVEIRSYRGSTYTQWLQGVIDHCMKLNGEFTLPMSYNEVKGIAKSIARWVWKRDSYSYQEFIDRQTRKSKLGAAKGGTARSMQYQDKRKQAQQLKVQGLNNTQIAKHIGVHRNSVNTWLK
ncbi:plasmid replicase [Acinetobacter sp. ANC 4654]|uniref:replication initiation protein n=1 Tax=Acinetobacter sp. ANC 4654 TaxID=1977872 RepID=UPI000A358944|nr:replication initiation protein [Acinetobacter sp. ANC 4654]OTG89841.1 plasmid replicase [Acinetobacter sp. ANC 4654]